LAYQIEQTSLSLVEKIIGYDHQYEKQKFTIYTLDYQGSFLRPDCRINNFIYFGIGLAWRGNFPHKYWISFDIMGY
jgi:hypothetical protein